MHSFRSSDFVLDFVHGDAFEDGPLSAEDTNKFWPAWFAGFPEIDFEVTRTIAVEGKEPGQIDVGVTGDIASDCFQQRAPAAEATLHYRGWC